MESWEAVIAVYIVRFGVVFAALGLAIANWVRTSRLGRERLSLPDDLKANVSRLRHEVESVNESLLTHVAKETARLSRAVTRERKEEDERLAAEATVAPSAPAPSNGPLATVPALTPEQLKVGLGRAAAQRNAERRKRRGA